MSLAPTYEKMNQDDFLAKFRTDSHNAHRALMKTPLFYAAELKGDYFTVKPKKTKRCNFWVNDLTATWWPSSFTSGSRQACLRAYPLLSRVGSGDDVFVLIPKDKSELVTCPASSFYRSFPKANAALGIAKVDNHGLGEWVKRLAGLVGDKVDGVDSLVKLNATLKELDQVIRANKTELTKKLKSGDLDDVDYQVLKGAILSSNLHDYLKSLLDPETNGFVRSSGATLVHPQKDAEIWTSSECLLIRRSAYIKLVEEGKLK